MSSKSISSGKTKAGQHVEGDAIDFPSTGSPQSSGHRPSLLKTTIKRASVKSLRRSISSTFHLHNSSSVDDEAADASDDESSFRSSLETPPTPDHHHHHHLLHLPFHRHHSHSGRRSLSGVGSGSGSDHTGSIIPEPEEHDTSAKPAVHSFVVLGRRNRTQSEETQPTLESSPPFVKSDVETESIGSSLSQSHSDESVPVTVEIQEQEPPSHKSEFESLADIPTIVEPDSSSSFLDDVQGAYHEDELVADGPASVTVEVLEVQEQAESQKPESEPVSSSSSLPDKSNDQEVYQSDDHPVDESGSVTVEVQEVQEQEREPQLQKSEFESTVVTSSFVHDESDVLGNDDGDGHAVDEPASVTVEVQEVQDQEIQPQSQPEFGSTTELPPVSSSHEDEESGTQGVHDGDDHAVDRPAIETQEQEMELQSQKPEETPMPVEPVFSPSLLHDEKSIPGAYHEDELILTPVRGNDSPISISGSIDSDSSLLSSDWTSIDASTPGTSINDDSPQNMDSKESSDLEHRHLHLAHLSSSASSRTPTPSLPKDRAPSQSTTPVLSPSTPPLPISPTPPRHHRNAQSPFVFPEEDDIITPYVLNELVIPALGGSPRTRPRSWTYPPKSSDLRRRDVDTSTSDLDSDSYTPRSNPSTLVDSTFIRELVWLIWVSVRRRISLYLTWWLPSPVQRMCLGLRRYLQPLYEPNSSDYYSL